MRAKSNIFRQKFQAESESSPRRLIIRPIKQPRYILLHRKDTLELEATDEDGIESSFDIAHQINDKVVSGCWVAEVFVFISGNQRLQYVVSGQVETLSHLEKQLFLLGYESSLGRMYCVDKEMNFTYYNLNLSLLEYQCAMVRKDFATAEMHFEQIPEALHTRVARYVYILTPS